MTSAKKTLTKKPKKVPLKDVIRTMPKTVLTTAEVRTAIVSWLGMLDDGADEKARWAGRVLGPNATVGDLVYHIQEQVEDWIETMDAEDCD